MTYRENAAPQSPPDLSRTWWQEGLAWKIERTPEVESPEFRRRAGGRWWFGPLCVRTPTTNGEPGGHEMMQGVPPEVGNVYKGSVLWLLDLDTPRWRTGPCPHRERWVIHCNNGIEFVERLQPVPCTCEEYPALPTTPPARVHNALYLLILLSLLAQTHLRH